VSNYLRAQPRPDRHAGFLALGDPVFQRSDRSSQPTPLPDHGLLVNVVQRCSNAATHGIKVGDVLMSFNGAPLYDPYDLNPVPEPGRPVSVKVWREGRVLQYELAPGTLGVRIDRSIGEPPCARRWCTTEARNARPVLASSSHNSLGSQIGHASRPGGFPLRCRRAGWSCPPHLGPNWEGHAKGMTNMASEMIRAVFSSRPFADA
jgi:hypothetical protein